MEAFGNLWVAPDIYQDQEKADFFSFSARPTIEGLPFPTKYTMDGLVAVAGLDQNMEHLIEVRIDDEVTYSQTLSADYLKENSSKRGEIFLSATLKNFNIKTAGVHTFSLWVDKLRLDDFKIWFV